MTLQTISFGEWTPDLADIGNPGLTLAQNVVTHRGGYMPFKSISEDTTALSAYARGAFSASDFEGNSEVYAGDETKLYRLGGTGTWADVSGSTFSTDAENSWTFLKWGEKVIASNDETTQIRSFGGSGNFAALSGAPACKDMAVCRGFIVMGNVLSGSRYSNRVWWSGLENETAWTPSPATQSDYQDLVGDGGRVMAVSGGDITVIFQERAIWEMEYVGPPTLFRFRQTSTSIGCEATKSVIRYGNNIYFLSEDGFMEYQIGGNLTPIGHEKIDNWFFDRVNKDKYYRITSVSDVPNAKIMWGYCNGGGDPDEIIIYDWHTGMWSYAVIDHELLYRGRSVGYTLDGLDTVSAQLDSLPASLDSAAWKGGAIYAYAFSTAHKSGTFEGSALTSRLETGEISSGSLNTLFCNNVRPIVEGTTATNTLYIASRNTLQNNISYSSGVTVNDIGNHPFRVQGRFLRFRIDTAGGFEHAVGLRAELIEKGAR